MKRIGASGEALATGWETSAATPGEPPDAWIPCTAPTTAAAALRAAGLWSLDGPVRAFDAEDWWFRTRFRGSGEATLCLDGIATVADVTLNGAPVCAVAGMFTAHRRSVALAGDNELVIRCRALEPLLGARRPRPRWRVPMLAHQQLRWWRTTLLGRTPGWSPPCAPVGPWRPVRIERAAGVDLGIATRLEGDRGILEVTGAHGPIVLTRDGRRWETSDASIEIPGADKWWPHTHGEPALYALAVGGVDAGFVGFRSLELDRDADGFGLVVNGAPVFCRGACWTPLDPVALAVPREQTFAALAQARDAGANMLRIGGTMVYEDEAFHDAADRLGILVWQDFMFANMDYPDDDPAFVAAVTDEARQALDRVAGRPSTAVLCGNSEVEQQAAMWGAPRARWSPRLFHEILPALALEACPDVPYWPSSAHGGAFPHQASAGTTSYYGVGAYLRPLEDARRAEVRFATECLAFANVPAAVPPALRVHHPAWKARVPRDLGAGWDFDDVRDHYLAREFGIDPTRLRQADHDRYLALGRAVTGEVMARVFAEWRRARSTCRGGLVWFLRDLWPGAGWGVVDAAGAPKAAYHYLRRAWAPAALHLSDEGGNGLAVHVVNERDTPLAGELAVALWRDGDIAVGRGTRPLEVAARGTCEIPVAALFDGFSDPGWAYRFGPPACDVVVASFADCAPAFHFPLGLPSRREPDVGLAATLRGDALTISTRRFAQSIAIDAPGFVPDDDWFHLAPGATRIVKLRGEGAARGTVAALNAEAVAKFASG